MAYQSDSESNSDSGDDSVEPCGNTLGWCPGNNQASGLHNWSSSANSKVYRLCGDECRKECIGLHEDSAELMCKQESKRPCCQIAARPWTCRPGGFLTACSTFALTGWWAVSIGCPRDSSLHALTILSGNGGSAISRSVSCTFCT